MKNTGAEAQGDPASRALIAAPWLWIAVAACAALIGAAGYATYRYHLDEAREEALVRLSKLADFKAREISAWIEERRGDARLLAGVPGFARELARRVAAGRAQTQGPFAAFLGSLVTAYAYQSAFVLDPEGRLVLEVGKVPAPSSLPLEQARTAMRSGQIALTELRRAEPDAAPILDIIVPLSEEAEGAPLGAVVLRIDASQYLFPLIEFWPDLEGSTELILARREGDSVVYLNDVRHLKGTALVRRVPLSRSRSPSVQAVLSPGQSVTAVDYRGVEVISVSRAIEQADWVLVVKRDLAEVAAGSIRVALATSFFVFLLIGATAGIVGLRLAGQRRKYEQRLRQERQALERHFDYSIRYARDIILLRDASGRIVECNDAACAAYGYSREELIGSDLDMVRAPEARATALRDLEHAARPGGATFETLNRRKDGSVFPVEVSARLIEVEGNRYVQAIVRDISERRAAQSALEREALRNRALMETAIDGIKILDDKGFLLEANPAFLRMLGYERDELIGRHVGDWDAQFSREEVRERLASFAPGTSRRLETQHLRKDGSICDVELSTNCVEVEGKRYIFVAARDITQRKAAERRIERLMRMYATLTAANEAVVRAGSEQELFAAICRVAVEQGGMLGAFIRLADAETRLLNVVAVSEGLRPMAERIEVSTDPAASQRQSLAAIAFAEDRIVIDNDRLANLNDSARREIFRAAGVRSAAALPLHRAGRPAGTLVLNAAQPGFFDPDMVALLEQMAEDVSYALENFDGERRRTQAEREVRESEERFRGLVEQSIAGIVIVQDGRIAYLNPRFAEIFGYAPNELLGRPVAETVAEEDRALVMENIRRRVSGEVRSMHYSFKGVRKDGTRIVIGVHGTAATVDGQPAIIGLLQDISERERAQQQIQSYIGQLEQSMLGTVSAVSAIAEMRDPYTAGHEKRVGALARRIGEEMGMPESDCRGLEIAGGVHDIGKVSVPSEILSKPGKLSRLEFEIIKTHPRTGYDVLKEIAFPWPLAQATLQHHERLDGSGYPDGLKGGEIILEARILAVADVVEAMASHRPYRPTLGAEQALEEIERFRGDRYDAKVVDACLRLFREKSYQIPA